MAAGCPHVKQLQLVSDKSFLNPRNWACVECGFTDSVWACLLCNNVSCGRANSSHALKHFEQTKHPIAVEVNQRYVHCYLCDDYVLSDNSSGDIALVQSLLEQVALQQYQESCSRSGRVIKPAQALFTRSKSRVEEAIDKAADKHYTALCHWRFSQLARAFNTWRYFVAANKLAEVSQVSDGRGRHVGGKRKRKALTPGMTGFRNLGNTCYMNSVLQSLSHLFVFRDCFKQLLPKTPPIDASLPEAPASKRPALSAREGPPPHVPYARQTTMECFQHITTRPPGLVGRCGRARRDKGGLSGGGGGGRITKCSTQSKPATEEEDTNNNLCVEMHALMRVMWSGKWAVVTPHAVLNAVWQLAPAFHGYTQHDAQEFLCELLFVLQGELSEWPTIPLIPSPSSKPLHPHQLLPSLFQGQLLSKVTYKTCGHTSSALEPFWNLSLHFPQDDKKPKLLEDLLQLFTSHEDLEGEEYQCDKCERQRHERQRQGASKQYLIAQSPEVLRIHLKRFRWFGRTQHKINTHVQFPFQFNVQPYLAAMGEEGVTRAGDWDRSYRLSSVIVHHGMGFKSGHYTAYCWNFEAESWVHCNDARISRSTAKEVLNCQAYILFYTQGQGAHHQAIGL